MTVYFNKRNQSYTVNRDGNRNYKNYSIGIFGKYAKELAKKTDETGRKYRNYYEFYDDYFIIIIHSKKYGYQKVYVDLEYYDIIKNYRWHVDKGRHTFYCKSKYKNNNDVWKSIKLHRLIMQSDKDVFIDHINGNGLDCRRNNLREVDNSTNQKNRISQNNIFKNVILRTDKYGNMSFIARWVEKDKKKSKSFSVNKLGYRKALNKAIIKSIKERKKNGYIVKEKIVNVRRIEKI